MRLSLLARKLGIQPSALIDFFDDKAIHGNSKLEEEQIDQVLAAFGPLPEEAEEETPVPAKEPVEEDQGSAPSEILEATNSNEAMTEEPTPKEVVEGDAVTVDTSEVETATVETAAAKSAVVESADVDTAVLDTADVETAVVETADEVDAIVEDTTEEVRDQIAEADEPTVEATATTEEAPSEASESTESVDPIGEETEDHTLQVDAQQPVEEEALAPPPLEASLQQVTEELAPVVESTAEASAIEDPITEEHLDVAHFQTDEETNASTQEDEEAAHVLDAEEVDVDPDIVEQSEDITTSVEVEPVKSRKVKVMEVSELLELAEKEAQEREESGEIVAETDEPESDSALTEMDTDEEVLIKAPKVYLPGLTVKGKIDLPEPKPKVAKTEEESDEKGKRKRKRKDDNPIARKRKREERENERQKQKEWRQLKEKKRQHYMKTVATKAAPPPKPRKPKKTEASPSKRSAQPEQKMNALQRFWKWMNT